MAGRAGGKPCKRRVNAVGNHAVSTVYLCHLHAVCKIHGACHAVDCNLRQLAVTRREITVAYTANPRRGFHGEMP
jgi:hypothetical protein